MIPVLNVFVEDSCDIENAEHLTIFFTFAVF